MAGGSKESVQFLMPIFEALKPKGKGGFVHAGAAGSGHFVKMIHNGIEYALMQSYAEGLALLNNSPLVDNPAEVMSSWRNGTVIRSWLLELAADAIAGDTPDDKLKDVDQYIADSGEGRWTAQFAIDNKISVPVIMHSLMNRFASQDDKHTVNKLIALLRHSFGGHVVGKKS
jgi:6-phosphogluconate dehydrogenase